MKSKIKCKTCLKYYSTKYHLQRHIEDIHLKIKKFVCEFCYKKFFTTYRLKIHLRTEHFTKYFNCVKRGKSFIYKLEHIEPDYDLQNCKKPKGNFTCTICFKSYKHKRSLNRHKSSVHVNKQFKCNKCSKKFKIRYNLQRHINAVHLKIKNFICGHCSKKFNARSDMERHIYGKHL